MKLVRITAAVILALVVLACMFPTLVVADASDEQFRNDTDLAPSIRYPLGTDELGRNRLARLLHGTRTSLLLAPAAALTSVTVAALIGLAAGLGGSWSTRVFEASADLTGSLPWLLLLIALRAALPLDSPPMTTTAITFGLLALLGWAGPARVIRNLAAGLRNEDFVIQSRALGIGGWRFFSRSLFPNVWPVAVAQFWVQIPIFILTEANLGLLGLGVPEPYASLGRQLKDLESYSAVTAKPWLAAPAVLLTALVAGMWLLSSAGEVNE